MEPTFTEIAEVHDPTLLPEVSRRVASTLPVLVIVDDQGLITANDRLQYAAKQIKIITLFMKPIIDKIKESIDEAKDRRDKALKPWQDLDIQCRVEMARYQRVRQDERDKALREAQILQEKNQVKIEKKADKLEASGQVTKAAEVRASAQDVAVELPDALPELKGSRLSKTYYAECVDIKKLCLAVANGTVPADLVEANLSALKRKANADKETFSVPGCALKFTEEIKRTR